MVEPSDKDISKKTEEDKEEDKEESKGKVDPKKYLEEQLEGLKLDPTHKTMLKEAEPTAGEFKEQAFKLLTQINQDKGSKDYKLQKKIQNLTPLYDSHDFWDSQPVPKAYEEFDVEMVDQAIDVPKTVSDVRQEPISLPAGFYWADVDINDEVQAQEVYSLLTKHYVEDDDNMFRFDYSIPFLQWALTPPGYHKEWLIGIRHSKNNNLFGFISGIPVNVNVRGKGKLMAEINFLCVHRSFRTKKMAPVLIREVTRRVNILDIWQAIYTAGIVIPKPFAKTTYWHRSLNPKKLIDVRFSSLPQGTPMARYLKILKLPKEPQIKGVKVMELKHLKQVHKLLMDYFSKNLEVYFEFTEEDIQHFILPVHKNVIEAYVVEDEEGVVTDFFSFYRLPSSILKHVEHKTLQVAYSFYNVAGKHDIVDLMRDALIVAQKLGIDVFNSLDIMENDKFLEELKFGVGDGTLNYYFYNWRVPDIAPQHLGAVLV